MITATETMEKTMATTKSTMVTAGNTNTMTVTVTIKECVMNGTTVQAEVTMVLTVVATA